MSPPRAAQDYKGACSYFENSYLLNPKPATLISTANMHLKMGHVAVASEVYTRVLSSAAGELSQREREVALRKIAICATMGTG